MTENPSIRGGAGPVRNDGPGAAPKSPKSEGGGPAFRALLEKLESQARGLREAGETLDRPEELAGAVDRARESIDDAVSLSEELLEAYRAAQQKADGTEGADE